jgi:predicted ABC-type ATPase
MFAGPNGSGKSTLKSLLPNSLLGVYLNPDEIESSLRKQAYLDVEQFKVDAQADEMRAYFQSSRLLQTIGFGELAKKLHFERNAIDCSRLEVNSNVASVIVGFLRDKLLKSRQSFTFETVMSHRSKIDVLQQAQAIGFRTYLYYIATDDQRSIYRELLTE